MDRRDRGRSPPRGPRHNDRIKSEQNDSRRSRSPYRASNDRRYNERDRHDGPRGRQPGDRNGFDKRWDVPPGPKVLGKSDRELDSRRISKSPPNVKRERALDIKPTINRNGHPKGVAAADAKPRMDRGSETRRLAAASADTVAVPAFFTMPIDWENPEQAMQRVMGFVSFRSTKNTKVPGNDRNYGAHKGEVVQYRQYMNRRGGFNRPLSPTRGKKFAQPVDTSKVNS